MVKTLLQKLNIEVVREEGANQYLCKCPFCGKPKLYINRDNGLFDCKRGCKQGNAFQLATALEPNKTEAVKVLVECGLMFDRNNSSSQKRAQTPVKSTQSIAKTGGPAKTTKEKSRPAKSLIKRNLLRVLTDEEIAKFCKAKSINPEAFKKLGPLGHKEKPWVLLPGRWPEDPKKACGFMRCHIDGKSLIQLKDREEKYPLLFRSKHGLLALPWFMEQKSDVVIFCEAWRDMLAAISQGYTAIASTGGASAKVDPFLPAFANKNVYFLFDADKPGQAAANKYAEKVLTVANEVYMCRLPYTVENKHGKDLFDYVSEGGDIATLIKEATLFESANNDSTNKSPDMPQGEMLIRICEKNVKDFFRDQFDQPHVLLHFEGEHPHDEPVLVSSKRFKQWLARQFREQMKAPPGTAGIQQAQLQVEAICGDKPRRTLHNRVAHTDDGKILYDLTNENWEAVSISPKGWEVVEKPPIFRSFHHQIPQVVPVLNGDAKLLFNFCNIAEEDQCPFLVTVASYFIPDIPLPILSFSGPPGTGKTTTTKRTKNLVDPSAIDHLTSPKDEQSAEHHCHHHRVVAYDNISHIQQWYSDSLCRVATGGGSSQRKLYTDGDDVVRSYQRPVILNAVGNVTYRPDLLDRCILIETAAITNPMPEAECRRLWQEQKPFILGGMFDAISKAMSIKAEWPGRLPRMADFAAWGVKLADALGYGSKMFVDAYSEAIEQKWIDSLERNPFAKYVIDLLALSEDGEWEGSSSDLLDSLPHDLRGQKLIPQTPVAIGRELMQLTPPLEKVGIGCRQTKSGKKRVWSLSYLMPGFDDIPI